MRRRPITIEEPKLITIKGTIWTKRNVFSVARLAFLEVIPIHMPNQHRATRLAVLVANAANAVTIVVSHSCPVRPPTRRGFQFAPTGTVATTVPPVLLFVPAAAFEAVAALAAAEAIIRRIETWDNPELTNCKARTMHTGMANVRSNARHWPSTIFLSLKGVARRSSI